MIQRKLPARLVDQPQSSAPGAGEAGRARAPPPPARRQPGTPCRQGRRRSRPRSPPAPASPRNLAIGDSIAPPSPTRSQATPLPPQELAELDQVVEVLARELLRPRNGETAHHPAVVQHAPEGVEPRLAQDVRHIGDLTAHAQVGLVAAVTQLCLVPGHAPKRRRDLDPEHVPPDRRPQPLHELEDLLPARERHLQVELGELGGAVGAGRLVAEAAGDLVVPLVAGDHVQLLEGLRRLRQRVELAGVGARRHQELARALRRRLVEDRRLQLPEPVVLEVAADRLGEQEARPQVAAHLVAAQVEVAVVQA